MGNLTGVRYCRDRHVVKPSALEARRYRWSRSRVSRAGKLAHWIFSVHYVHGVVRGYEIRMVRGREQRAGSDLRLRFRVGIHGNETLCSGVLVRYDETVVCRVGAEICSHSHRSRSGSS